MIQKTSPVRIIRKSIIVLIIMLCLVSINSSPVFALSVDDYFEYGHTLKLSKTEINGSEIFNATVEGQATCKQDLPLPVSSACLTSRIVAVHQVSGAKVTLNPSFTLTIEPFPNNVGETSQSTAVVSLRFPGVSESGTYSIAAELIVAKVKVKVLGVEIDVASYLPLSETMGSVTYTSGGGGGGGGGGGIQVGPETDLTDYIDADGVYTENITRKSEDAKCWLTVDKGTIGLTEAGEPLSEISILVIEEPPTPPENSSVVGLTYDFGPAGAAFDPPVAITFTYDESLVPANVAEENLVLAMWDEEAGEWVSLVCIVDPVANTITTEVSHFTTFTIMAYTRLAAFIAKDLSITPDVVGIDEEVTIAFLVANTGDVAGSYKAILKIDHVVEETRDITLTAGAGREATFTTTRGVTGIYVVTVDGLSGTFVVGTPAVFVAGDLSITPDMVDIGEKITISVIVANTGDRTDSYKATLKIDDIVISTEDVTLAGGASRKVIFTTASATAGTYEITVDGLSGTLLVKAPPLPSPAPTPAPLPQPQPEPVNWWLIGGIIAGCIIVGMIIWLVIRRRP